MSSIFLLAPLGWQQALTDPVILMRWVTVGVYFAATLLTLLIALNSRLDTRLPRARLTQFFLISLAVILLLLGINKLVNYSGDITRFGRSLAIQQGWFGERRLIQYSTIQLLTLFLLPVLGLLCWFFRHILRYYGVTLVATLFLVGFVCIRSISWHYMDALINRQTLGLRINWILELGSLILIAVSLLSGHWMQRRTEP